MGDGRSAVEAPGLDYRGEGAPLGGADREHGAGVTEFAVLHQPVTRQVRPPRYAGLLPLSDRLAELGGIREQ
jgi:hypothetical protein